MAEYQSSVRHFLDAQNKARRLDEFQHVVSGRAMNLTLFDFKLRACRHLEAEQAKANPDNALVALLCEAVRLAREHEDQARRGIPVNGEIEHGR